MVNLGSVEMSWLSCSFAMPIA